VRVVDVAGNGPGLADIARHVIGCHSTQHTRFQHACRVSMTWRATSAKRHLVDDGRDGVHAAVQDQQVARRPLGNGGARLGLHPGPHTPRPLPFQLSDLSIFEVLREYARALG